MKFCDINYIQLIILLIINISYACYGMLDFTGQAIDSPINGPAPGPWDIQATPPGKFQNGVTQIEVPHTASVKVCSLEME